MHKWFEQNHEKEQELIAGYYKTSTGKPSITWSESVDMALCFGWIDGIRRSIDEERYCIRFTPRRPKSSWSAINIAKVEALKKQGLMTPAGLAVFVNAEKTRFRQYSYENESVTLPDEFLIIFQKNSSAWKFFNSQPPSYRKVVFRWVMSAKQEETQRKRLNELINDSSDKLRIKPMRREKK